MKTPSRGPILRSARTGTLATQAILGVNLNMNGQLILGWELLIFLFFRIVIFPFIPFLIIFLLLPNFLLIVIIFLLPGMLRKV